MEACTTQPATVIYYQLNLGSSVGLSSGAPLVWWGRSERAGRRAAASERAPLATRVAGIRVTIQFRQVSMRNSEANRTRPIWAGDALDRLAGQFDRRVHQAD